MKRVYITDCEGPVAKNDNAFELTTHFVPDGDRLFSLLSRYDDILAYTYRRKGYRAGNTLRLIVPFLKAYGATNENTAAFCRENILLVPKAADLLIWAHQYLPTYLVSTSYSAYIVSLCELVGFPTEQAFSTQLDLDSCQFTSEEVEWVRKKAREILEFPMIPEPGEKGDGEVGQTVEALDRIFEALSVGGPGEIMTGVDPVGGGEKAKRVSSVVHRLGCELDAVMYVGDSITDVEAFRAVRKGGGLTVSFNGNRYAVENAEIAVISKTAEVLKGVVSTFKEHGKRQAMELARRWGNSGWPLVCAITPRNLPMIAEESSKMRRNLRGEKIGILG